MTKDELIALAKTTAAIYGLDPCLVCAVCEWESEDWNVWATRYEPLFMSKYVAPLYMSNKISATEAYTRSMSYGLMQVMGQVARESGFAGKFLTELCEPVANLHFGCVHLAAKLKAANGDVHKALLLWNGGSDLTYPDHVLPLMEKYR